MNAHRNSNISQNLSTISIGSFRVASQSMHNAVMGEFGGSLVDDNVVAASEAAGGVTPAPYVSSGTTQEVIELEEFQSWPQSAGRMPEPSVSLVRMWMGLADQTEFPRGVICSTHIMIDVDCFRALVFYSLQNHWNTV